MSAESRYLSVFADLMQGSAIKSWIIVALIVVIGIEGGVIYFQATKPLQVLTIPGAAPGIYTAGQVPLSVINSYAESFVKDITNYDEYSFVRNINSAGALMTPQCRGKHSDEIKKWKKTLFKYDMSKTFFIDQAPEVISKNPYTLQFTGDFAERTSDGKAVMHGTQIVRVVVVPAVRTNSNFLGYAIDDWEIEQHEKAGS